MPTPASPPDRDDEPDLAGVDRLVLELLELSGPEREARAAEHAVREPELTRHALRRLRILADHDLLGPTAPTLAERRSIGGYRLLRQIGSGGMGAVWLAEDPALRRTVALKVLHEAALGSRRARARLHREALAAARLDHPCLCPVYEVGEVDGVPFLAMRHVPGHTLGALLAAARETRRDRVDLDPGARAAPELAASGERPDDALRTVTLVERVARGIHVAHLAGLVHRDLKPDNIMVEPDGNPVVLDFGLAQDTTTEERLTLSGDRLGTPAYMAPEQVDGRSGSIDARTDVYALGVVLHECLTLELPVQAANREDLYRAIRAGAAAEAARSARRVPRDLRAILATATAPEPARRYASALALAEDLARFRTRMPVLAHPAGPMLRARRWTQRNPLAALVLATLTLGIALALVALGQVQAALNEAEDLAQAGRARTTSETDPAAGLAHALPAYERTPGVETLSTLYEALANTHVERVLLGHRAAVWRSVFSGDGRRIATCSDDGTVRIWDLASGTSLVLQHDHNVVDIDGDGERVVTSSRGGEVALWSFLGARLAAPQLPGAAGPDGQTFRVRFSPDRSRVAITTFGGLAYLWEIASDTVLPLPGHPGMLWDVIFSPDSRRVLTLVGFGSQIAPTTNEFTARLWWIDGTRGPELRGHTDSLTAAAFSRDGYWIMTASLDGTVRLWRSDGAFERVALRYSSGIRCLALHPDGERFAAGALDGSVRICRMDGDSEPHVFRHDDAVRSIEFSRDGSTVLTASWDRTVRLHDLWGRLLRNFRGHAHHVMHATFSPDGNRVASASYDHTVRLWRTDDEEFAIWSEHTRRIASITHSPDGPAFASASTDGTVRLREAGRSLRLEIGAPANRVAFSPSGGWVAATTDDHMVAVWGRTGQRRAVFPAPSRTAKQLPRAWRNATVAFLGEDRLLVGCQDGTVGIRDLDGNPLAGPGRQHGVEIQDLAVHPLGTHYVEARWDYAAVVRSLAGTPAPPANHAGWVVRAQFSPDGARLLTASADGTAKLWRWHDGRLAPERTLDHDAALTWAEFAPDGGSLLTTAMDGVLRIWSAGGELLLRIRVGPSTLWCATWDRNGTHVLTGSDNGIVRRWPVRVDAVLALARERLNR
ncbi:MAG: serine/threonine protein kinase [Planctomycetes bacterium]|nr:serine/threonine protein kinase [Planctomycetota bacterium]